MGLIRLWQVAERVKWLSDRAGGVHSAPFGTEQAAGFSDPARPGQAEERQEAHGLTLSSFGRIGEASAAIATASGTIVKPSDAPVELRRPS